MQILYLSATMSVSNVGNLQENTVIIQFLSFRTDRSNSVDPDQTAVRSGSTLFAIQSASFGRIILRLNLSIQILGYLQQYLGCPTNFYGNPCTIKTDPGKQSRLKPDATECLCCLH